MSRGCSGSPRLRCARTEDRHNPRSGIVKHIVDDATRAAEVISRIRALTGKNKAERGPVDLNEIIEQVAVLARAELQRSRVVVRLELRKDLPLVLADRIQTQQVLLNLLMNAADAMRDVRGRVRELLIQTLAHESGQVLVAVRDTGVGVHPDARGRIFGQSCCEHAPGRAGADDHVVI